MLYVIKDKPEKRSREAILEQIVQEHDAGLRRFIRVRLGTSVDCDDIVQGVYTRLVQIENLEAHFGGRLDTVRNYLFQIAVNLITDGYRRAQVRRESAHLPYDKVAVFSTTTSPERQLQGKRKLQQIHAALASLKPEYQQAFALSRMENMSYREISDTMGVSVSTVEKYISAALVAIRQRVSL